MESQEIKNTYICEFCCAPFTKKEDFLLHFTESSCKKQSICRIESFQQNPVTDESKLQPLEPSNDVETPVDPSTEACQSSFQVVSSEAPQILCTVDMILCEQGNKIFITPDAIRAAEQQENLQQILSICEIASNSGCETMGVSNVVVSTTHPDVITEQEVTNVIASVEEMETTPSLETTSGGTEQESSMKSQLQNENIQSQMSQITVEQHAGDQSMKDEAMSTELVQISDQQPESQEEPAFECDVCQRKFKKSSGLERHKVVHTRDNSKSYTCDTCGRIFTTHNRLLKHEEVHEKTREEEHRKKHEQQETNEEGKTDENKETFICETCNKTFNQSCCLLEHERVHFKENLKKNKDKFQCAHCDKTFHAHSHLARHEKSHTKKKESFDCETCGSSFPRQTTLLKHQTTHTDVKPYLCNLCGRGFMQSSNLTTHLRTHSKTKPYPCRSCGKAFSHSSSRVIHERTHTGEKPYLCETCGKKFRQSGDLAKHQRSHTGEKPYQCAVCDKGFSVQSNLLAHLRIHVKRNVAQSPVTVTMVMAEGSTDEAIVESSS